MLTKNYPHPSPQHSNTVRKFFAHVASSDPMGKRKDVEAFYSNVLVIVHIIDEMFL